MSTLLKLVIPEVPLTGANDNRLRLLLERSFPEDVVLPNLRSMLRVELAMTRANCKPKPSVIDQYVEFAKAVALDLEAQARASGDYPEEQFGSDYFSLCSGAFFMDLIKKADDTLMDNSSPTANTDNTNLEN